MNQSSKEVDTVAIENAVREIIKAVGEDPTREGLLETPRRVARMYKELFSGLLADPARHLNVHFTEQYDEMVVLRDIPFYSMCEHHLLPFMGRAHVAYLPRGKVVGVSKLARVVEEGNGAMRQRRAWQRRNRLDDVIADAAAATLSGT